jgi:D-alanine-D-alanine ligase
MSSPSSPSSSSSDVIVLFGGSSTERRVSVASAQHVLSVLADASGWFEAPDGRVFAVSPAALQAHQRAFEVDFLPGGTAAFPSVAAALDDGAAHGKTFFLGYHGSFGEDGAVQRLLEARGLAFTGSGSEASARAFDKTSAKQVARKAGVPCAEEALLPRGDEKGCAAALRELLGRFGRAVAKPVAGGSSVGLFHVRSPAEIPAVARAAAASSEPYLAEEFLAGRELTVGVVQSLGGVRALPCSEVRLDEGFAFDFEGKYLGKGTTEITPAEVSQDVAESAQLLAITAHQALGCEGYTRTDLIVTTRGPVFLETNTLPGLTRRSFIPQQLDAEGTSMREFLGEQLALARRRRDRAPKG